eukprot:TRINITY_DN484_c0_g1_i1.p2 TRINITY_DN484_c0_g1~~TRINITY_DN484_c0_g1_i1.p2  ORF type:complete len:259 (-),score=75.35 TRINITY_DN484_c0_g1_i1:731-1507(-)
MTVASTISFCLMVLVVINSLLLGVSALRPLPTGSALGRSNIQLRTADSTLAMADLRGALRRTVPRNGAPAAEQQRSAVHQCSAGSSAASSSGSSAIGCRSSISIEPQRGAQTPRQRATTAKLREITARLQSEPSRAAWIASGDVPSGAAPSPDKLGITGGSTVLERPAPKTVVERASKREDVDKFKVMLFNDSGNTREYVARALVQVTGVTESNAYEIMISAHTNGMSLVGIWHSELAELYSDQLKSRGLISEIFPVD